MDQSQLDDFKRYHSYLLTRSKLGAFYRKFFLYPKLSKYLTGKTLDIGCGIGDFCKFRPNTVGTDINPFNIEHCRNLGLDVYPSLGPLPFHDSTFESALLDNVLEHIEHPKDLLLEITRVLKPKGVLVIGVPGEQGFRYDPDHKIFYRQKELVSLLASVGFSIEKFFNTPAKSKFLDKKMRQYCLYGVFRKA